MLRRIVNSVNSGKIQGKLASKFFNLAEIYSVHNRTIKKQLEKDSTNACFIKINSHR